MDSWQLEREELDQMIQRLGSAEFTSDDDLEDARWLRTYLGKTGFVQLGFAFQGVMMLYEASTEWYDHYQRLVEVAEDFGGIAVHADDGEREPCLRSCAITRAAGDRVDDDCDRHGPFKSQLSSLNLQV